MADDILSVAEFERLLSRGRGKAILYLQTHDAAPYREAIRRCCLTNTAYDPQCEGTREIYLMQVIDLSGIADSICDDAIRALLARDDFRGWDFDRLFALVGRFAQRGHKMARQALYAWCRLHYDPQASSPGALYPLLELDGIEAFFFLLDPRQSGHPFDMDGDDYSDFESFLEELEERLGGEEIFQAFQEATQNQPDFEWAIQTIYARRQAREDEREARRSRSPEKDWTDLSYADLRRIMEAERMRDSYRLRKWGEKASEEDLYAAAVDFVTQPLTLDHMGAYVGIFQKRVFPLDDVSRFFELARRTDLINEPFHLSRLPYLAMNALESISHPQIRDFALELIRTRYEPGKAVGLLQNYFEEADWALIKSLFDAGLDEHEYHALGFSIHDVFEKHPSPDAITSLIRMFDANPCSFCRVRVVESLVSLNALPDWIAEECRYDANLDLRAYAERGFIDDPDD